MTDNMALWRQVEKTDPRYTKSVNQRGGFTAIGAQWQLMRATEIWGPYGAAWRIADCNWSTIDGEPPSLVLRCFFVAPNIQFELAVDMRWTAGNDCHKKLLTEARSKALSMLGFSADVFLGRFDDQAYVNDVSVAFVDEERLRDGFRKAIAKATTIDALEANEQRIEQLASGEEMSLTVYRELSAMVADRRAELE
jgi:hypothetical protein